MREQVVVTENMVKAASNELNNWVNKWGSHEAMRAALNAALNPPDRRKSERRVAEDWVSCGPKVQTTSAVVIDDAAVQRAWEAWFNTPVGPEAVTNAMFAAFPGAVDARKKAQPSGNHRD